jgi:hypothetical protein
MFAQESIARRFSVLLGMVLMLAVRLAFMPLQAAHAEGPVRYAKPAATGTGNCSSWANACTLQTALTGATSGNEIWVAAGTHKPTDGTDRTVTFQLVDGVALYGGFAMTETLRSQRDPAANITILSGDIGTPGDNGDNSYHVVTGANAFDATSATSATLDGFTITAGNANGIGGFDQPYGGGIYSVFCSLTLTSVTFSGNSAQHGGGMYDFSGGPSLTNVTFSGNSAIDFGGGLRIDNGEPTLTTVTFISNSAKLGGGMYIITGSPALTNVIFITNSANYGGGMYNNFGSPALTDVTFSGNGASYGGGIYNEGGNPAFTNVTFSSNSAILDGGGMVIGAFSPALTSVTFVSNTAANGGGLFNTSVRLALTNVTFSGNSATGVSGVGGGMYNYSGSPALTNVTLAGNSATTQGGGMYNSTSSPAITNTICWGNTAPSGAQIGNNSSTPSVSDSVVQDGCPAGSTCTTTPITADPKLGTLGNYGGWTQTIPLQAGSSAINAGNADYCPATDQRGEARAGRCDIGAYEFQPVVFAAAGGKTSGTCDSWTNACELRYALTSTVSGWDIWVAAGTYKPTAGTDRGATFQLKSGVALYGGFAGTEVVRTERNAAANVTILSGEIGVAGNSDNSYHVVTGATGAILDGFTITAGNANDGSNPNDRGGGMYNNNSSPAVMNVTFSGNSAQYGGGMYNIYPGSSPTLTNVTFSGNSAQYGGGMYNFNGNSPRLSNVTFSGNVAAVEGGGMYNNTSNPTLTNVTFSGNSAAGAGGGMDNRYSSPMLTNVTFSGNMATGAAGVGGGIYNYHSDSRPTLTNVTFSGNSATASGGGMDNYAGIPTLTNVTFSSNSATGVGGVGGGMANSSGSNAQIRNTIFWGNTAPGAGGQIHNVASTPVVSYSVAQGGCPSGSNCTTVIITTTPMLGPLGNYGGATQTIPLLVGSSAIDAGNATYCPATDQRGVARVGACDIGAFEQDDFTAPTVDTFTVITPSTGLNITVTTFTASDNIDVTGYLITESATPPVIGAEGWTGTAPTTYTAATDGAYTLYPWAKDAAGNVSDVFASPREVVVDTTAPAVVSIVRASANPTSAAIVTFTVTFSEAVTGVEVSDFALTNTGTISGELVTGVVGGPAVYTVTLSTGTGDGDLRLDVAASATISDLAGNSLAGLPYTGGESYTVDKSPPAVVSIVRANSNPTSAAIVTFTVTFSEAVTGVDASDFALTKTFTLIGESVTGVSGGPTVYAVTVNTGTGGGVIRLDVPVGATISDIAGNPLAGLPYTVGETYDVRLYRTYLPLVLKF